MDNNKKDVLKSLMIKEMDYSTHFFARMVYVLFCVNRFNSLGFKVGDWRDVNEQERAQM